MSSNLKLKIDEPELISVSRAAEILKLSPSALYNGKAGTEVLTKVPQGRRVFFILSEVLDHRRKLVVGAQELRKTLTLVPERE